MTREEAKLYMTLYKQRLINSVAVVELSDDIAAFDMAIKSLEPKTGHWMITPRETQTFDWIDFGDEEKTYYITCSECDYQFTSTSNMTDFLFCPKCGADMRG